jgi:6-phosphogluconolactonase (cycloisomerase 2 family)
MKKQQVSIILAIVSLLVLVVPAAAAKPNNAHPGSPGAVFIMTNNPSGNSVLAYSRGADGILTWKGTFATNGLGAAGLTGSNQGGLALSKDAKSLLVVNAGSNDISAFRVNHVGLTFTDKIGSGGTFPISITIHGNVVYVLNAGGKDTNGNIAGFHLSDDGQLSPIPESVQPLSGNAASAQISFNPTGSVLVVAEKSTSLIDTYIVDSDGVATGPTTHASSGATPFGFDFDNKGQLIVSEAAGGPSGTSAVSSYSLSNTGDLTTLSGSIADTQQAACWLVVTGNSRYAYTANAHSGTISSYSIASNGEVTLRQVVAANTGAGNLDLALTSNGGFLYNFINASHTIEGFNVHSDGSLTLVDTVTGVPAGADGLAAN